MKESPSYDLYLFCQLLVFMLTLIFISNIIQHVMLIGLAGSNILFIKKKIKLLKMMKLLLYMSPGLLGFAIAVFVFTKDSQLRFYNTLYMLLHLLTIVLLSFLYTSAINLTSLIFYCLNKKWLPLTIGFLLIMVETTTRFVIQDWQKIFLIYRMRQYRKLQILKPVFLLLLNTISYAQDIAINTFVRGLIMDKKIIVASPILTQTSKILWWQYLFILMPLVILIFH